MRVTVRFSDFWENSNSTIDRFLIPLIESVYQSEVQVEYESRKMVDLEVFSVFPSRKSFSRRVLNKVSKYTYETSRLMEGTILANSKKSMWFSGENKRAPIANRYDTYLGFEPEGLLPNSHYLPLWVLNFDNFGKGPAHGFTSTVIHQEDLLLARKFDKSMKNKFCCAFMGNPTSFRVGILKKLGEVETLGLFGSAFGNKVDDKLAVSSEYRFSFAFENDLYPGYVTEKLLEGYLSKTVPLYWGMDSQKFFNSKAFINLNDFTILEDFLSAVKVHNSDEDLYAYTYEQPLLNRKYDISELVTKLRNDLL
jgi:hypothetical protein